MLRINSSLTGLVVLGSLCCSASANAADPEVTPDEARIAKLLDIAVREDGTVKSFAALPWARDAKITGIVNLRYVKECTPSSAITYKYNDILIVYWDDSTDGSEPCSWEGYRAELKVKNGYIEKAEFETTVTTIVPSLRVDK